MVAGFIALLNVTVTTVLGHAPGAALGGASEIAVGGVTVGLGVELWSGSLHPAVKMSSRNAANPIVCVPYLCMAVILFLSPSVPRLFASISQTNSR